MSRVRSLALAVVTCSAFACSSEAAPAATTEALAPAAPTAPVAAAPVAAAPFDAAVTFKTTCGACHGETGEGNGPAGMALTPRPANFGDPAFWAGKDKAYIAKVIKEGGAAVGKSPLMVAWGGQFNDQQIDALADIVMGFKK